MKLLNQPFYKVLEHLLKGNAAWREKTRTTIYLAQEARTTMKSFYVVNPEFPLIEEWTSKPCFVSIDPEGYHAGWLPSLPDLLAEDWIILKGPE